MSVSVIVPTYNGAHKLSTIVQAIRKQSVQPDEILVVVDGSTDHTREVLKELKAETPQLITVEQENKGRAAVRNKGAEVARGKLLVFFDDDMLPEKDCLSVHLQHHQKYPNSILTGAQIDFDVNQPEIQQYKAQLSRKWTAPLKSKEQTPLTKEEIFITAANFSLPKKLFAEIGGFDSRLTDAEDFDLAVRAFKAGIPLYFNYGAFSWHNDVITGKSYVRRLRQYHKAHQRLKELKPDLYKDFQQLSTSVPGGLKGKVFLFFTNSYWVEWLDKATWKFILPRKFRYKLYDLITTANGVYFPEKVLL